MLPQAVRGISKGGELEVTKVVLRSGESQESLLRRFRKQVTRDRVLSDAKRRRFFVSKSEQRRIALRKAIRRERKRQWREENRGRR
jgi:small subunit ribosomal protein S21